ncbi:MAG: ABC transporter ATP-binding protein [Candidatus Gracilibacteria bacterium]|nr:ABC transporter ATP-binding protein [Candidatus Gracilibacteria bacterium]
MINIKKLTKSYIIGGVPSMILKGIDLEIKQGDFIALMGPSGSGKSTLMNMIGILDIPTTGEYFFHDTNVANFTEDEQAIFRRDKIGFIFQGYNLLAKLPAWEQVALPLAYKGWSSSKRYQRAIEVLNEVGLSDKINHTPDMLSGGQQQRVCIARALVCDPALLLADEPTGALDSKTSAEILKLFSYLNKEKGKTILMITHDSNVASYAHKIIHIKDGLIDN